MRNGRSAPGVFFVAFVRGAPAGLFLVLLVGCGWLPIPLPPEDAGVRERPVRIEDAELAADGRSVEVRFTGGASFDPANPCSADYVAEAEIVDGELLIGVFELVHPVEFDEDVVCASMGFPRVIAVDLPARFDGFLVRDRAGGAFLLRAPPRLATLPDPPGGWVLLGSESIHADDDTGRWQQIWSSEADPDAVREEVLLRLVHAFDGHVDDRHAQRTFDRQVNGRPASLSVYEPTGQMLLVWSIGPDQLALHGNRFHFTEDELLALADSVVLENG